VKYEDHLRILLSGRKKERMGRGGVEAAHAVEAAGEFTKRVKRTNNL